jgi:uncharacterized membrane protein YbhN (UPF0104 family)
VFCRELGWRFSYELGMAEQATNVLLPTGGAGGLALGAWALRQGGMATDFIGRRSVAFFLITSATNFVTGAVCGLLMLTGLASDPAPFVLTLVFTAGMLLLMTATALLPSVLDRLEPHQHSGRVGRGVRAGLATIAEGVRDTGSLLRSSRSALGGAIGYMGFDAASLAAAFAAFGSLPSLAPFLLAYVVGQLGGLIPLPGGIGGTDGGLIGALVLYGSPLDQAAAAVLVYRAFQLGIPSVLGVVAFVQLRRRLGDATAPASMCAPLAEPIERVKPAHATTP